MKYPSVEQNVPMNAHSQVLDWGVKLSLLIVTVWESFNHKCSSLELSTHTVAILKGS